MDEKIDEVIGQYELHLSGKRRIRGGLLLDTNEGSFTLTGYRENAARVDFDEAVKKVLAEKGCLCVDEGLKNKNGSWLTKDHMGNFWHMKHWYPGKECDLKGDEVTFAARHLAKLHRLLIIPHDELELPSDAEMMAASAEENEWKRKFVPVEEKNPEDIFLRRSKEMRRIYNYIKKKKKKNEMEICILNLFPAFYEQAETAKEEISKTDCHGFAERSVKEGRIFHGSYNYHNILFKEKDVITTNFERCAYGLQVMDLYGFLRKILEKNNWNTQKGMKVLESYRKERSLDTVEGNLLYVLLLFPEKFWKQMNFYYNGKKSWMSAKNLDKIKKLEEQEQERKKFLGEMKRVLFS